MSALAVYLEEEGIATTTIGLVRLHLEKIAPPRALWVPFEMGRPLGPPGHPEFQRRVLRKALGLLVAPKTAPLIEDYPEEDPTAIDDEHWEPPAIRATGLLEEVEQLQPSYERALERFGRTTVGISRLEIMAAAGYLQRFNTAEPLPSPHENMSGLALMRFACDDIKAYYLEAASAGGQQASSRQLLGWFWNRTRAGELIRELRAVCLASDDSKRRLVGNSLVPRAWL